MLKPKPKLIVLSIDGVPIDLLKRLMQEGVMPNLAELASHVGIRSMHSVHPTVSCVAWAGYSTGMNPGKHGIYGFIDRQPNSYNLMLPNSSNLAAENIWQILSRAGMRVFGLNVPSTYPPKEVNGILIGGFLAPSLEKVAYPSQESDYLSSIDYRIDSDAQLARRNKRAMLEDLDITLARRMEAMFHYLQKDNWNFFHTHIMGTDRINHFLWQKMEQGDPEFYHGFRDYYARIDRAVGKLLEQLDDNTPLMIFSDHGFCALKQEVQLSRYLVQTGWTIPAETIKHPLSIEPSKSRAYCLIPGRIYINLQGREPGGIVPLEEYQQTREQLTNDLLKLQDPDTGSQVIRKVIPREDIYWPSTSHGPLDLPPAQVATHDGTFGRAADLIAIPFDGYDLKLGLAGKTIFQKTQLEGMHTYHDAFVIARHVDLPTDNLEIMMLTQAILKKLAVEPPVDMDGIGKAVTPVF